MAAIKLKSGMDYYCIQQYDSGEAQTVTSRADYTPYRVSPELYFIIIIII